MRCRHGNEEGWNGSHAASALCGVAAGRRQRLIVGGEVSPSGFVVFLVHENLKEEDGISIEVSGLTGIVDYHPGHFKSEEIRRAEDF